SRFQPTQQVNLSSALISDGGSGVAHLGAETVEAVTKTTRSRCEDSHSYPAVGPCEGASLVARPCQLPLHSKALSSDSQEQQRSRSLTQARVDDSPAAGTPRAPHPAGDVLPRRALD